MKLYQSKSAFDKAVNDFSTNAEKINDQAHRLLCSAYSLCMNDRNTGPIESVLNAFPAGMRRSDAVKHARAAGPFSVFLDKNTKKVKVKLQKSAKGEDLEPLVNLEWAIDNPFWTMTNDDARIREVSLDSIIQSAMKRIQNGLNGEGKVRLKDDSGKAERILSGLEEVRASLEA